jgi:putative restriction endonuclease
MCILLANQETRGGAGAVSTEGGTIGEIRFKDNSYKAKGKMPILNVLLSHMARTDLRTRKELIVAFNLYLKLPFGKLDKRTKEVQNLAHIIGRTDNAVAMRLNNFAHVDPYHQQRGIVGLANGRKQVEPIWDEFSHNQEDLVFESERILAEYQHKTIEEAYPEIEFDLKDLKGEIKLRLVKTRVNQSVFRQMVLKTYDTRCAISGIGLSELLVAGHIIP